MIPRSVSMDDGDVCLPESLVQEILLRLPVKSLVRFMSVCKSWRSFISSSWFIAQHLTTHNNNNNKINHPYLFLNVGYPPGYGVHVLSYDTIEERVVEVKSTFQFPTDTTMLTNNTPAELLAVNGCCNGLLLVGCSENRRMHWDRFVWNPATRQTKLVPVPPFLVTKRCGPVPDGYPDVVYEDIVLGFDSKRMEYKVVALHSFYGVRPDRYVTAEVYSFKSADTTTSSTWRTVATIPRRGRTLLHAGSVLHNNSGITSWICRDYEWDENGSRVKQYRSEILSFDMSNDAIVITPLPNDITNCCAVTDDGLPRATGLLVLNDCLAVAKCNMASSTLQGSSDIWIMSGECGVKASWSKLFTIGPLEGCPELLGFCEDGKVLFTNMPQLLLYDPVTQQTKDLEFSEYLTRLFTYRDCLIPFMSTL